MRLRREYEYICLNFRYMNIYIYIYILDEFRILYYSQRDWGDHVSQIKNFVAL